MATEAVKRRLVDSRTDDRVLSWRFMTGVDRDELLRVRGTYNSGSLTMFERERIELAVQEYLAEHEIPRHDLHALIFRKTKFDGPNGPEAKFSSPIYCGFIRNIRQRAAINRTVDQVMWYMSRVYTKYRAIGRPWTPEEDDQILSLHALGMGFRAIGRKIERADIKERYYYLRDRAKFGVSYAWTQEEEKRLVDGITFICQRDSIQDPSLFNCWTELSALIGTRSANQVRMKWRREVRPIPGTGPLNMTYTLFKLEHYESLIARMSVKCAAAVDEREIAWERLVEPDEPWSASYLRARWSELKHACNPSIAEGLTLQGL
eukprot:jgi/Hompol1/3319/HPOL_006468-RA